MSHVWHCLLYTVELLILSCQDTSGNGRGSAHCLFVVQLFWAQHSQYVHWHIRAISTKINNLFPVLSVIAHVVSMLLYCACISTIIYTCLSVFIYVGGQISYQKYLIKRPAYDVTPLVYTFTLNGWLDEWGLITCLNSLLSININPNKSLIRTKHTQNITIHLVKVYN